MPMVCPQCRDSFEQRLACPRCGVRLTYNAERATQGHESRWAHSGFGRFVIGVILAQGIFQGLRQLCMAALLAFGESSLQNFAETLAGVLLLQGFQVLGILVGSAVAGAGQRRGAVLGSAVGLANGLVSLLLQPKGIQQLTPVTLYGQPILHTVLGFLGGGIGSSIWRPLLPIALQTPGKSEKPAVAGPRRSSLFHGKIAWGRVLIGTAVGVCGTFWAHVILDIVLEASEGALAISTSLQMQMVTWEITALALLAGSGLAGAGTSNSLKQGLCVGLATGLLLVGMRLSSRPERLHMLLIIAGSSLMLGLAGSWFGGQLFPPVFRAPRRKRSNSLIY